MEIIKKGKLKQYKATCGKCGCEFRFNETETHLFSSLSPRPPNLNLVYRYISCPACNRDVKQGSWKEIKEC